MATTFSYTIPNEISVQISGPALPSVDPETSEAYPLAGPLPNYTIETELLRKGNMYLGQKFTITITGTTLVDPSKSMLVKGERQAAIHEKIAEIISATYADDRDIGPRPGTLVISDHGGINPITFTDAILVSVSATEQTEQSQGVQDQGYVFTFESNNFSCKDEQGNPISTLDSLYQPDETSTGNRPDSRFIVDYSEDWSLSPNEERTLLEPFKTAGLEPRQDLIGDQAEASPSNVFKTWTLTHNITATGIPFNSPEVGGVDTLGYGNNAAGFRWAKRFIDARLASMGNDPLADSTTAWGEGETTDGAGNPIRFRDPTGSDFGDSSNSSNLPPVSHDYGDGNTGANFKAFNQVNEFKRGVTEGTYSVTRTWQIANMFGFNTPAKMEVDFTLDGGIAGSNINTIGVNVSVQGWTEPNDGDSAAVASGSGDTANLGELGMDTKYKHAWNWVNMYVLPLPVPQTEPGKWNDIPPGPTVADPSTYATDLIYEWAKRYYDDVVAWRSQSPQSGGTITSADIPPWLRDNASTQLQPKPLTFSRTDNETTGTITIATSFNDETPLFPGSTAANVSVDMNNEDGLVETIAIKPVIGKSNGPVIQDMKITPERSRSVTLSLTMDRYYRYVVPDGFTWIDTYWRPLLGNYTAGPYLGQAIPVYIRSRTQNFNPTTGAYSATVEYVWTDSEPLPFGSPPEGYQPQSNLSSTLPGVIDRDDQGPVTP